jgi:hypothetical protein
VLAQAVAVGDRLDRDSHHDWVWLLATAAHIGDMKTAHRPLV